MDREEYPLQKKSDILVDDTIIDTEKVKKETNKTNITDILEFQDYDEVLDDGTFLATGTMEITTNKTSGNKMIEYQVENEDTVEEMDFYEFAITGDSDYDFLRNNMKLYL